MNKEEQLNLRTKAYELYKKDIGNTTEVVNFKTFLNAEYQVKWYIKSLLQNKELIEMYNEDLKRQTIDKRVNAVEGMFRLMYKIEEEREQRNNVLEEVMYQVEVCEGFCRPVQEETIKEWLKLRSAIQVQQKAHTHKMSKLKIA